MDVRADQSMSIHAAKKTKRSIARRAVVFAAPFLVLVAAAAGVAGLMATAPKPDKNTQASLPIAVEIATARAEETSLRVTTQGQVKSKNEADVAAQVSGQVLYISPALEAGAYFKKGDVLAKIDPAQYKLSVDRSRSQVARAREALARAKSEASLAEQDWKDLGLTGDPSELTLQKPQVDAALADLKTAEAAVRESELNLERTEIRAPFDGRVMSRKANVGDFISPGAVLASIFAVDIAQVRIALTDADLGVLGLAPGYSAGDSGNSPEARLSTVVAGAPREWTGKLTLIDASVDPSTRLVYGLIEVADPFGESQTAPLAPGLFVDVEIDSGERQSLVSIPRGALKKNEYIYVIDGEGAIKARAVTPAMADAKTLFFRDGVTAGEKVVASFLPSPRDGMKVRDINAPAPAEEKVADAKNQKPK
ncbi:MAG: efflux RND transporter periplasmic adaptor subunit [Pseudomonadota bacterium]